MGSISAQTIPTLTKFINNMGILLKKAEAHADAKGIPHETIITHRLIADQREYVPLPPPLSS